MKKKLIAGTLLTAVLLSGCGARDMTPGHTHSSSGVYSWNGTEHWYSCECGEKTELALHKLDEDMRCVDCGLEVWTMDDGYVDVTAYDEYGTAVAMISYDPDGNILSSSEYKYSYDEQGNIMCCESFCDGELQSREEYVMAGDGSTRILSWTSFSEGERDYNEYDESGNMVYAAHYNSDDVVTHEAWSEYALDENEDFYECRTVSVYEDGTKIEAEYNLHGEATLRRIYDADGNLTAEDIWEYGYNQDGKMEWMKEYRNGALTHEIQNFAEFTDEWDTTSRYPENETEYYEDGTKLVRINGTNTEPELETMYNADGSVSYTRRYVYETFENGNWKRIQIYQNDALLVDTEYVMDAENIWSRKAAMTEYCDDGTKVITEYDENEEIVRQEQYNADGSKILTPEA